MAIWRDKTRQEYDHLSLKLKAIFSWAEWFIMAKFGKTVEVTEAYRSDKEHRRLLVALGRAYYPTPHSDYRAIDFIIQDGKVLEYEDVEETINLLFPYGKDRYNTCWYHKGTGWHIHLQVKPGTV